MAEAAEAPVDGQSGEHGGWEELLARVLLYELAAEVAAEELAAARGEILSMSSDDDAAPAGRSEDEAAWEDLLDEITEEVAAETHRAAVAQALEGTFNKTRARLRRQALLAGRYERIESIGAGVYGTVYKVRDAEMGPLAMKCVKLAAGGDPAARRKALCAEASLVGRLRADSPFIASLRYATTNRPGLFVTFSDLAVGGSLSDALEARGLGRDGVRVAVDLPDPHALGQRGLLELSQEARAGQHRPHRGADRTHGGDASQRDPGAVKGASEGDEPVHVTVGLHELDGVQRDQAPHGEADDVDLLHLQVLTNLPNAPRQKHGGFSKRRGLEGAVAVGEDRASLGLQSLGEREHGAPGAEKSVHEDNGRGVCLHDRPLHGDLVAAHEMTGVVQPVPNGVDRRFDAAATGFTSTHVSLS